MQPKFFHPDLYYLDAKVANDIFDGLDSDPMSHLQRELGDGEPSFDANVDDFMASNNSNHEDTDELNSNRAESRAVRKGGRKKSPRGASKSPEKRASRSPTKGSRKLKKQTSRLDPQGLIVYLLISSPLFLFDCEL